jgi:TPR repeat protein
MTYVWIARRSSTLITTVLAAVLAACSHGAANSAPGGGVTGQIGPAQGLLQKCLGTSWGASRMNRAPDTQQYCNQLPASEAFNRAGAIWQSGDEAGAINPLRQAAEAGNPMAQLRLGISYDQGAGVPRDSHEAMKWYSKAAAQGEPAAQAELGAMYEDGVLAPENWDLAAKLYYVSAMQGWTNGQFLLGRAFEFGIGVPQNRQSAIEWFRKAAEQGAQRAQYWAQWLSSPTNNIGFRDDTERNVLMGGVRPRFGLLSGDPAGIAFHSSNERMQWLRGENKAVTNSEDEALRNVHRNNVEACQRAGGSNCNFQP